MASQAPRRRARRSRSFARLHALQYDCSVSKLRPIGANELAGKLRLHARHILCSDRSLWREDGPPGVNR